MNDKMYDEFQREAALMVNMKPHANVVKSFGVCIDKGDFHKIDLYLLLTFSLENKPTAIVTEFLEKGSLRWSSLFIVYLQGSPGR
jgi:hypothetical protein